MLFRFQTLLRDLQDLAYYARMSARLLANQYKLRKESVTVVGLTLPLRNPILLHQGREWLKKMGQALQSAEDKND